MDKNLKVFKEYAYTFDQSVKWINYKYYHSIRVMEKSIWLSKKLGLDKKNIEIATFIGLTHDISRFKQWTMFSTFYDFNSFDHGLESTNILFKEKLIDKFEVNSEGYDIIKVAIKNHNKYQIESGLNELELLHSKIIRDTDKLDILYAFSTKRITELSNDDSEISEEVNKKFCNNKCVNYEKVKTKNDRIIELISLVYDINFIESLELIKQEGYLNNMLNRLEYKDKVRKYFEIINKYIDERIEENVR